MEDLYEIAARQYAAFSSGQAAKCGAGSPPTWEQSALAACLAAGPRAVTSHRAAARIWRLLEPTDDTVEITVPYPRFPRLQGVVVHRSKDLLAGHTTVRRQAMLDRLSGHGRAGAGVLRKVLAEREFGEGVSDSDLEKRMARLLRRAGLPPAASPSSCARRRSCFWRRWTSPIRM